MRTPKPTINHMPITEARVNLGAVVKRVHLGGEYFILEKDGIPVAGLLSVDELEDYLELRNTKINVQLASSKKDFEAGRAGDAWALLDELKKERAAKTKRSSKLTKIA